MSMPTRSICLHLAQHVSRITGVSHHFSAEEPVARASR
jgi:hypothetical protein